MTHPAADNAPAVHNIACGADHPCLCAVGLHHTETPIEIRERYSLAPADAIAFMHGVRENGLSDQVLVLSTCNRVEIYAVGRGEPFRRRMRRAFLSLETGAPVAADPPGLFVKSGIEAARHLFEVCAGLDSMMLGENQIKQQMRQAFELSREAEMCGAEMHMLIEAAFRTGKRIRTETHLNEGTLSVSKACVLKGEQALDGLQGRRCLVIGAGKIGGTASRDIAERRPGALWVVNRTRSRAEALAGECGGEAFDYDALPELLGRAEFILAAAYAPEYAVRRALYDDTCAGARPGRVCMVDAAVPRSLDPALGDLEGVSLFDIEHLTEIVESNRICRQQAAAQARAIVEEEIRQFAEAMDGAQLGPKIERLRDEYMAGLETAMEQLIATHGEAEATRREKDLRREHAHKLHLAIQALKRR